MKSNVVCCSLILAIGLLCAVGCDGNVASSPGKEVPTKVALAAEDAQPDNEPIAESDPEETPPVESVPDESVVAVDDTPVQVEAESPDASSDESELADAAESSEVAEVVKEVPFPEATKPVSLVTKTETPERASDIDSPTHRQAKMLQPTVDGKPVRLNTFCVNTDGKIIAACGGKQKVPVMSEEGGYTFSEIDEPACLIIFDSSGTQVDKWDLEFRPTALSTSPDGNIFVGGEGKLVQLSATGKTIVTGDAPNVEDLEIFKEQAMKKAEAQAAQFGDMFKGQIESIEKRIAKIEEVDENDRSRIQDAQLKAYRQQLEMYESIAEQQTERISPDAILKQALKITSLAASDKDVFLVCRSLEGSGYSIWRTNHNFEDSREVLDGVRGCCGQMDIQCCEGNLVIAENSAFRVAIYDRDGQEINSFGSRDRSSKSGFGSCCNPMNVLPMSDGSLLTAESSIGHIKRFDQEGKLISYIGRARVGGGCKHCALGFDSKTDQFYMMHEDENKICVLANESTMPSQSEEQASVAKMRAEFDGRFLGTWELATGAEKKEEEGDDEGSLVVPSINEMLFTSMTFKQDGSLEVQGGQYASMEFTWTWAPESSDGDKLSIQVYGDQVAMMPMTFDLNAENAAHVEVSGMAGAVEVSAKRTHGCDGKPCECEEKDDEDTVALK